MNFTKRKVFISHYKGDRSDVDAYQVRTARAHLIDNLLPMMGCNSKCTICKVTH